MSDAILPPLLGGLLIGASAVLLLWFEGRIAGISGIVSGLVTGPRSDRGWRLAFIAGLWLGGLILLRVMPASIPRHLGGSWPVILLAGLLVGLGTRAANGCTSGHGVCGLGRRSRRSLVAVAVFMLVAIVTAQFIRPLLGGLT